MDEYQEAREKLSDYENGWLACLHLYAHWKDGTQYVGSTGRTFNAAARSFLLERDHPAERVDRLYPLRVAA